MYQAYGQQLNIFISSNNEMWLVFIVLIIDRKSEAHESDPQVHDPQIRGQMLGPSEKKKIALVFSSLPLEGGIEWWNIIRLEALFPKIAKKQLVIAVHNFKKYSYLMGSYASLLAEWELWLYEKNQF